MIARYTRPEMGAVWTDQAKLEAWRAVEVAAAEALDGPSEAELEAIRGATITVEAVQEREKVTDHDTAAFVDVLGASAGPAGRWIHYGLTSSDVVDTGLALQLARAGKIAVRGARPRRARARGGAGLDEGRPARPPRRAALGHRARRRGDGALRPGGPAS